MQLSELLRNMRKELGLSRTKMAEVLNVSPFTLKNWELGYRGVPADLLLHIAQHKEPHVRGYIYTLLQAKVTNVDMYAREGS